MRRAITGYHTDNLGDPIADLSCGHGQHVRHRPPFFPRPWVTTPEGRAEKLGTELDCVRCDRSEMPEHLVAYRRTPVFDEDSIPAGLRAQHSTRAGVWGLLHVLQGRLRYCVETPGIMALVLTPDTKCVIVPEHRHHVEPDGAVSFFVEFWRAPPA